MQNTRAKANAALNEQDAQMIPYTASLSLVVQAKQRAYVPERVLLSIVNNVSLGAEDESEKEVILHAIFGRQFQNREAK